jgi:hypothetical protein
MHTRTLTWASRVALHTLLEALTHSRSLQRVAIYFRVAAASSVAPLWQYN